MINSIRFNFGLVIFFLFIFISVAYSSSGQVVQDARELSQLKAEYDNAQVLFENLQQKYPGRNKKEIVKILDNDVEKIEKSIADLKIYRAGISILNREKDNGLLEQIEKKATVTLVNKKLSKYQLEIDGEASLFIGPDLYNKYLQASMSIASKSSGMNIPVQAVKVSHKVKIANLRESGAIDSVLNSLKKARETGMDTIGKLKDQRKTISGMEDLVKKISALEKQKPSTGEKKIKYVRFEPDIAFRGEWPDVLVDRSYELKLVVVYEDGTIKTNPEYKCLKGSNYLRLTKEGLHVLKATVQLAGSKDVYPIETKVFGKRKKILATVRTPNDSLGKSFFAKETDGTIKIPLYLNHMDVSEFNLYISQQKEYSTADTSDYMILTPDIIWKENESVRYVEVRIIDDDIQEGNETLILNVDSVYPVKDKVKIYVVIEDDDRGGAIGFFEKSIDVAPDQKRVSIRIGREGMSRNDVSVYFQTEDGTAIRGKDYFEKKVKITWKESKKNVQHVEVELMGHKRDKETYFWVILKNPTNGATLGKNNKIRVNLLKGTAQPAGSQPAGTPKIYFKKDNIEVKEDAGAVTILVLRTGDLGRKATVNWKIYDGTTDANDDYIPDFGRLEWQPNDVGPRPITIDVIDDQLPERLEYAYLELYNPQMPGRSVDITNQNPIKLSIIDNDESRDAAENGQRPGCLSLKITPRRLTGRPGQTFRFDTIFKVTALMSDHTEVDVTDDPSLVWEPGIQYTFPDESRFNERLEVKVRFMDCWAGARIDVEYPFWSDPMSDAEDTAAKAPLPPADAYDWYVVCNRKSLDMVYTQHVDLMRHKVVAGPFAGPREPAMWIEANCPRARCNQNGECSQSVAVRGGPWGVYCNRNSGLIVVTKQPQVHHSKLEADFHSEREGQLWIDQHYPSGRCDKSGRYIEDGFSEISTQIGKSKPLNREDNDGFAEIGGEQTHQILDESSEASQISQGGSKGFSMRNVEKIMGEEFLRKKEAQKKEAQAFLDEFLARNTKEFNDYQMKKAAQKKKAEELKKTPYKKEPISPDSGSALGKKYVEELKCKNAKQFLNKAIRAGNTEAAKNILKEIEGSECDYYKDAASEIEKYEKLLAKKREQQIKEKMESEKKKSSAENRPCRSCDGKANIYTWEGSIVTPFGGPYPEVPCTDSKQSYCIDECTGQKHCYETQSDIIRKRASQ